MLSLLNASRLGGVLCLLAMVGCGAEPNPTTYAVTGTVTYKGKPVPNASVILSPTGSATKGAVGKADSEGKFVLTTFQAGDGALPGTYSVAVTAYEDSGSTGSPEPAASEYVELSDEESMYDGEAKAGAPAKNLLPAKYANPASSGLEHSVSTEPSTLNLDLK